MNRFMGQLKQMACAMVTIAFVCALLFPVHVQAADGTPEANRLAETYVVMDAATGQVLVGSGEKISKYPASITKVVTLALVMQAINEGSITWDTNVTVSQSAMDALIPDASTAGLMAGETVSVRDLVYATQIKSANEAANVLAEVVGGSIDGFAVMMNAQVAALGLTDTHFTNPSGLPDKNHVTTAYDMARLTAWALSVPGFPEVYAATEYVMPPTNLYNGERGFFGTNSLLADENDYFYEGILGSKSGYTDPAMYTLATAATRDDTTLVCIVLRCQNNDDKYVATSELLDYCFVNFRRVTYSASDFAPAAVPVYGGGEGKLGDITVDGMQDVELLLHKDLSLEDITLQYNVPDVYVMGAGFAPSVSLVLGDGRLQNAEVFNQPLTFSGLDSVVAENTRAWIPRQSDGTRDYSTVFNVLKWLGIGVLIALAALLCLFTGRVLYVQHRRRQRRQRRLLAQREQMLRQRKAYAYRRPAVANSRRSAGVRNPAAGRQPVQLQVVSRSDTPARRAGMR